ncbi:MAG: tRNA lysidine(34) synthetase TilS, partial [Spirochaetales bacterium]|nr:tRNA lysidine(34) synthetase TilS [Spirochaetales bacterium]
RFIKPLIEAAVGKKDGIIIKGYGVRFYKRAKYLFCAVDIDSNRKKGYLIRIEANKSFVIPDSEIRVDCRFSDNVEAETADIVLNSGLISVPLLLRSKREGDLIQTGQGRKRLKQLLNEWHVPEEIRYRIPVLQDRKGILAVIGKPFGFKNRYSARALESKERGNIMLFFGKIK